MQVSDNTDRRNVVRGNVRCVGFTLMELLIVMTVMGVLAGFIVPVYLSTVAESRTSASAQNFSNDLKFARSQAIKTAGQVTVCARETAVKCGDDWNDGWLIVNNPGGANISGAGVVSSPDDNIFRADAASDFVTLPGTPASTISLVSFNSVGSILPLMNPPVTGFVFVNNAVSDYQLQVIITASGQVYLTQI